MTLKYQTFDALFEALARSEFRSKFRLIGDDRVFAELRSPELLNQHAHEILKNRIGASHPKNDGKQTPYKGHPVFTAQHATGCCCRSCLFKWHGIEKNRELSDRELNELSAVICEWIRRDLEKPAKKKRVRKGETLSLFD